MSLMSIFGLSGEETRVLFSLESWLVRLDISGTEDIELADRKTKWLLIWEENLFEKKFFGLISQKAPKSEDEVVLKILSIQDPQKRLLVLCEAISFAPYFNIKMDGGLSRDESLDEVNRENWSTSLIRIAEKVKIPKTFIQMWETKYLEALKDIGGRSDLLKKAAWGVIAAVALGATGGLVAPVIGGAIGGLMGLSGAAATSAGLAFLGGGAIAAGGAGMAGGVVALIGGGAVLGGATGLTISRSFFLQNRIVLSQLSKLEASLLTVFDQHENLSKLIDEVIDLQAGLLKKITKELESANLDPSEKKPLEKSADYYKIAIKRLNNEKLKIVGV